MLSRPYEVIKLFPRQVDRHDSSLPIVGASACILSGSRTPNPADPETGKTGLGPPASIPGAGLERPLIPSEGRAAHVPPLDAARRLGLGADTCPSPRRSRG